ncbi:hypothetical protein [Chitinophaga niabensis]|uniref:Uncharacterized protein n=1 Tax=Chitinophaga niabensis TaxID=536979 RepID=A0A1N6EFB3_9BACT|nr:hypothetical protein [Chitinophaga niabensis]SIN81700.1 hypothetical protein SAMN04488055_1557 [Chitinophaga niabensis]
MKKIKTKKVKEKKVVSEQLHEILLVTFAAVIILMLVFKTMFL